MEPEVCENLAVLDGAASPGPWFVRELKDEACMSAIAVSTAPDSANPFPDDWDGADILAACLVQSPPYVIPDDKRWQENAALIVAMRNALPELLRLAKVGAAAERASSVG